MSDIDANTIVPREIMAELRAKQGKGRIYGIDSLFSNFSPAQAVSALATMFWDSLHNLPEIIRFLPLHPATLRVCAFFLLARIRNTNFFLAIR